MAPIQEKVLNAISEVAKAQGITYVLNTQALLYVATDAVDLGSAVKTKLGLK
jgi:Skp family chaperone for outer membrane proteins